MGLGVRHIHDIGLPLLPIVQQVGMQGLPFDAQRRESLLMDFIEPELANLAGSLADCGITDAKSTKKLGAALAALGVPLEKHTKGGEQFAVDLEVLRRKHHEFNEADDRVRFPFLPTLIRFKQFEKARANLHSMVLCKDGRLRCRLNSLGTETGRYSSAGLGWCPRCHQPDHGTNLQNIAKNNAEIGLNLRDVIVARPGYTLLEFDYSMLELRILAYVANVKLLIERLERGDDIHSEHERDLFGTVGESRTLAKNFGFAAIYGGKAKAIQMALAKKGIFLELAEIERLRSIMLYERYPEIISWQIDAERQINALKLAKLPVAVRTVFGSARVLLGYEPLKEWLSTRIQGTAGWIMSFNLLRMRKQTRGYLCTQIHDAFLAEVPANMMMQYTAEMVELMERKVWMHDRFVRFPVDVSCGRRWSEMTKC